MPRKSKNAAPKAPSAVELVRDAVIETMSGCPITDEHNTQAAIRDAQPKERGQDGIFVQFGVLGTSPGEHPLAGKQFLITVQEITDSLDRP